MVDALHDIDVLIKVKLHDFNFHAVFSLDELKQEALIEHPHTLVDHIKVMLKAWVIPHVSPDGALE